MKRIYDFAGQSLEEARWIKRAWGYRRRLRAAERIIRAQHQELASCVEEKNLIVGDAVRVEAERDTLRAAATEAVNWLARINEAYGSGIIGRGEVERLRTALAQTDTRP